VIQVAQSYSAVSLVSGFSEGGGGETEQSGNLANFYCLVLTYLNSLAFQGIMKAVLRW